MLRDTLLRGVAAGLVLAGSIALAGCVPGGVTPDGKHVFFETDSQFSNQDTDHSQDVYERSGGKTTLVSAGQGNRGNDAFDAEFLGGSSDGSDVFFRTNEALTNADDDGGFSDIYRRSGNTTTLISDGRDEGTLFDVFFEGNSADGSRVFFTTNQALTSGDEDPEAQDVYMRKGSKTTLVSDGGDANLSASFQDMAASGRVAVIATQEPLTGNDDDGTDRDVFAWRDGDLKLASTGPEDPQNDLAVQYGGMSANGTRVLFETTGALTDDDGDSSQVDVYQRKGNRTTLVTPGDSAPNIHFEGSSLDATRVFVATQGELTNDDEDGAVRDIYVVRNGEFDLISTGPVPGGQGVEAFFAGASSSGAIAVFETLGQMTDDDDDSGNNDVYVRKAGSTKLVSQGPAGTGASTDAETGAISADGSLIFFETGEALVGADSDSADDVYSRKGNKTSLISRGKNGTGNGDFDAGLAFTSKDGAHAFFFTGEQLVPADDPSGTCTDTSDPACSGYERFRNKTKLVTRGN